MQAMNVQGDSDIGWDLSVHYPNIRAVCWFDLKKPEGSSNGLVADWGFSSPAVLRAFKDWLWKPASGGPAKGKQYWKLQVSHAGA